MNYKRVIPDFVTSLNILCGCFSICFALKGLFVFAFWAIVAAAVFDFFDGFVARMFKSVSKIGKELDSLCDVVSFGVAPGMMMYEYLVMSDTVCPWIALIAFLIPVFSALRLAKFNLDTRQSETFIGLPVPANALFISSLVTFTTQMPVLNDIFADGIAFSVISVFFPWLLVSEVPFFSFKNKHMSVKDRVLLVILLSVGILSLPLPVFVEWLTVQGLLLFDMVLYLILNVVNNIVNCATSCH